MLWTTCSRLSQACYNLAFFLWVVSDLAFWMTLLPYGDLAPMIWCVLCHAIMSNGEGPVGLTMESTVMFLMPYINSVRNVALLARIDI